MKIGDLIWLDYVDNKYIIKISGIEKIETHNKFSINGKVIWASKGANLDIGFDNSKINGNFYQFKSYSVYDENARIEDILMIEQL